MWLGDHVNGGLVVVYRVRAASSIAVKYIERLVAVMQAEWQSFFY